MRVVAQLEEIGNGGSADGRLDRRAAPRRSLRLEAVGGSPAVAPGTVTVRDISTEGMLIESAPGMLAETDLVEIALPEADVVQAHVVWVSGGFSGCRFAHPVSPAVVSAALLAGEPASAPAARSAAAERRTLGRATLAPTRNFSVALALALSGWAAIAAVLVLIWSR